MINEHEELFAGSGEIRALCRNTNWAATPLGPVSSWATSLRTLVRTALDSPFPINLWCGPALQLIYNDAYAHVLGSKHPNSFGAPGSEVWGEIWSQIQPMFETIAQGGPPVYADDAPFLIRREGGESKAWFTFALSAVRDEQGAVVAYLNIVSETTPRVLADRARELALSRAERAERRLTEVFEQAPAFLAVLRGEDHVFEYVNAAYYQLVGHRELLGRPVFEALPEVRGQGFEALLDTVVKSGEPFIGREVPVTVQRTPDSPPEERFVDLVYYPIREEEDLQSGLVAHGSDVTEHVLARREAQRARAEAEQANQAKSQFLANMSHEIRTPINAVLGYTDLLDAGVAGPLTEQQHQFLQRIQSSSKHLLGLVNDVLDLSKIEAGEMLVRVEHAEVRGIVGQAFEIIGAEATARSLVLEEDWQCQESIEVIADASRVRQIMLNLLSNALKFTPSGGAITMRCRMAEAPPAEAALPDVSPWVVIEVEDTGTGIDAVQLARIFQPFVQADSGHTRTAGGTGLGLTISRRLARLMGGDLTVKSEVGVGSTFSLWLPTPHQDLIRTRHSEWERADRMPAIAQEMPGLGAVGRMLLSATERVEAEIVDQLRAERTLPGAATMDRALLADHTAAQLAVLANNLTALDEGRSVPSLVSEGEEIQSILAVRHGDQRKRIGWRRQDVQLEFAIQHKVIDSFLRREAVRNTTADITKALGVVHRLLDDAEKASLKAFEGSESGE